MFVITGGGSGIGRALAQALAARGKEVLITGRREAALKETAKYSPLISLCCSDVSSEQGRNTILASLKNKDKLEGLVHNAGIIDPILPLANIPTSNWRATIETNLNAPLFLSQLLLNKLQTGRVLHVGSGAAYFPVKGWAAYCVSKAGLAMLTRCWQLESDKPAFASVMPGIIDTDMQVMIRQAQAMHQEKRDFFEKLKKENKLLNAETVAVFLTWLLLEVDIHEYSQKEWDIYEKSHHAHWLFPPHEVPDWE